MPTTSLPHTRRAIEPDGTVHAARYAGDRHHVTTACAAYPAPEYAFVEPTPHREITCTGCREALAARPVVSGPRCGNNPTYRLSPGDQQAVAQFLAYLARRRAGGPPEPRLRLAALGDERLVDAEPASTLDADGRYLQYPDEPF